jgi:hypothetical protein
MNRETLVKTIKMANRHVAEGKGHVARQREIVTELKRAGGHPRREFAARI